MKQYSQATPYERLLNNKVDHSHLTSLYRNMRYQVAPTRSILIDSRYAYNLPGLAYDYYGDTSYWRAILAFNGLTDAVNDIKVGVQISLPAKADVDALLATSNQDLVGKAMRI